MFKTLTLHHFIGWLHYGPERTVGESTRGSFIKYYTLWLFNIAMEHGPFIDGLPIKNGDFPWLC